MPKSALRSLFEPLLSVRLRSCRREGYRVLGLRQFVKLWLLLILNLPVVLLRGRAEALRRLALGMGRGGPLRLTYRGSTFLWDCGFNDRFVLDPPSFFTVQEMLIRDSYFAFHPDDVFANAKTVIDLGANRGLFSLAMAVRARLVVSVECLKEFVPLYEHSVKLNKFTNCVLEQAFIGPTAAGADGGVPSISMNDLLEKHGLVTVDFLKMDIEGAEFAVFREPGWLPRINNLSMEVHFDHGPLRELCTLLQQAGFDYRITTWDLEPIQDPGFHVPGGCCLLFANRRAARPNAGGR